MFWGMFNNMNSSNTIKCKNCGGLCDLENSRDGVMECKYCLTKFTLTQSENADVLHFLSVGEHELDICKFDDAYRAFSKAAEYDSEEPEAYWGMALSEFKVQYLKDEINNRLQPICYDFSDKSIKENVNYKKAVSLASPAQFSEYERKGREIDYIHKEFYKLKQSGLEYDCFICAKITDDNGVKTVDDGIANDLYYFLKDKGFKPFFSEREIQDKVGVDYEAYILYALFVSPCMIVVCSDKQYLHTPWIANEYKRFLMLMNDEQKQADSLAIVWVDEIIEKLPHKNGRIQGICIKNGDAYFKIIDFLDRCKFNKIPRIIRKTYADIDCSEKKTIEMQITKRALPKYDKKQLSVSEQTKLNVIDSILETRRYDIVIAKCKSLIESNPSCSIAYWKLFIAENDCISANEFCVSKKPVKNFYYLEAAIATGTKRQCSSYYAALYERIKRDPQIYLYKEYVALPDSDEIKIGELTELLYSKLNVNEPTLTKACEIFDELIKTVGDPDLYENMCVDFADKLYKIGRFTSALKYYKKANKVDVANHEIMWKIFLIDHSLNSDKDIMMFIANGNNHSIVEKELYCHGFNQFATRSIFESCISVSEQWQTDSAEWIDFLFSIIPIEYNSMFIECLDDVICALLSCGSYELADKYNNYYIAENSDVHKAYYNRIYIKHRTDNPFSFVNKCMALYDDCDYYMAIEKYSEKHADEKNIYIELIKAFDRLRSSYVYACNIEKFSFFGLNRIGFKLNVNEGLLRTIEALEKALPESKISCLRFKDIMLADKKIFKTNDRFDCAVKREKELRAQAAAVQFKQQENDDETYDDPQAAVKGRIWLFALSLINLVFIAVCTFIYLFSSYYINLFALVLVDIAISLFLLVATICNIEYRILLFKVILTINAASVIFFICDMIILFAS